MIKFDTKYSISKSNHCEEYNSGIDKVVRIGYTPLAERVKTIIRQADEAFALKATDFDDLSKVDPDHDDVMATVVSANEFDQFQYLSMLQDIQEEIQKRNEIIEAKAKEQQEEFERWKLSQAELQNNDISEASESEASDEEKSSDDV